MAVASTSVRAALDCVGDAFRMSSVTATGSEPLNRAFAALQAGDLTATEGLCKEFLARPDQIASLHFDALHLLAAAQFRAGRPADALANYDAALAIKPQAADVLNNRAVALKALGRFDEAIASYDNALEARPDFVEAIVNRGNALVQLKRYEEALTSYGRALAVRPDNATVLNNRGSVLNALGRFDEAVASYDKALVIRPDFVEALNNRGISLASLRRFEEALANCEQSLAVRPGNPQALATKGLAHHELEQLEAAVTSYDKALVADPQNAELRCRRARALSALGRSRDALADYEAAVTSRPDYAQAYNGQGLVLTDVRRFPEALRSFRKAQELEPTFVAAHRNELKLHLLTGDFRRAWWKEDQQAKCETPTTPPIKPKARQWDGLQLVSQKTILLHDGQSYGDVIQFCRYIPRLAARGARVIVDVAPPLRELLGAMPGVAQVISSEDITVAFDLHCPFGSLPRAFATTLDTVPNAVPYLPVAPHAADQWNDRLGANERPRIGIVWSQDDQLENAKRSMGLGDCLKLLSTDATFVCAQRNPSRADIELLREHPEILTFGGASIDFSEAAALLSRLDLLITVDSSMAHLAGALGKPVWVLLRHTPDWRWLIDREDSPWYPTARLFRQNANGDWNEVTERIAAEVQKFVKTNGPSPSLAPEVLTEPQLQQRVT
jgi:tetratricopeptide (TPR) repeat protein